MTNPSGSSMTQQSLLKSFDGPEREILIDQGTADNFLKRAT